MAGSLSKRHLAEDPMERRPCEKKGSRGKQAVFYQTEQTIEEIACDIINGVPKADILQKLRDGLYSSGKKVKQTMSYELYKAGVARLAINRCDRIEEARDVMWNRYENLYRESLESGNLANARQCLLDMMKLFGYSADAPNTAIQINSGGEGKLTVNFGFLNSNKEDGATV